MFVDFTVPTKYKDITVITFRNGTQLWNNIITELLKNC